MGKHDLDYQKDNGESLIREMRDLKRQVTQLRTTQQQGSQAMGLSVIEGYFTLTVVWDPSAPDYAPRVAWLDLQATQSEIMAASLVYDLYYLPPGGGDVIRLDDGTDAINEDLQWRVWLAYSSRVPGAGFISFVDMLTDGVEHNRVRLMARLKFFPGAAWLSEDTHTFLVQYQVRATTT